MNVLVLALLAAVIGADLATASKSMVLSSDTVVEDVNCEEWERLDVPEWRAEAGARLEVFDGTMDTYVRLPPGSTLTEASAFQIYWLLELACREDLNAGVMAGRVQ